MTYNCMRMATMMQDCRPWLLCATAALTVTLFASVEGSIAAQVTFTFDATVTEVLGSDNYVGQLPFQPVAGQSMSGKVTFTPIPFGQTSDNDAKLKIVWEGETFTALSHKLTTLDNYGGPLGSPIDALSVECGVLNGCANSSTGMLIREFALLLGTFQDVIPVGQPMDSADSWNLFDDRRIELFLTDVTDTRRISVFASVGPMQIVPEPALFLILASLGISFMAARRRFRR